MNNTQEAEVIESTALTVHEPPPPPSLFGTSDPSLVVKKAVAVANTLKGVIKQQKLISTISGKEYPRCEAWTLLGTMLGVFPVLVWTRKLDNGWEARVEARTRDGSIVGAAEAQCLNTERNWGNRDDFALRSMAQTRATAKCLRMPLGFVMTLAGLEPTPSEEMEGIQDAPRASQTRQRPPAQGQTPPAASQAKPAPFPTVEQRTKMIEHLNAKTGQPDRATVAEYFVKAGALIATESLEDLPLRFVPATAGQMRSLGAAIAGFAKDGDEAMLAFPPHQEPASGSTEKAAAPAAQPELTDAAHAKAHDEPWRKFPTPFGKNAGVPLGELPKNTLFGFWANYEVKTEYNGKPLAKDKIAKDQTFRDMLDRAGEHYEFTKAEDRAENEEQGDPGVPF